MAHSKTVVEPHPPNQPPAAAHFSRDRAGCVMIPANARPAHKRLRQKLAEIQEWNETSSMNPVVKGGKKLGIIIRPKEGFNVFATANTKGRGDDRDRLPDEAGSRAAGVGLLPPRAEHAGGVHAVPR